MHRSDEAIPTTRQCLEKTRIVAAVAERGANLRQAVRQATIEVDMRVVAPDRTAQLFLAHYFVGTRQEQREGSCRLRFEGRRTAVLAQQIRRRIKFERAEPISHSDYSRS